MLLNIKVEKYTKLNHDYSMKKKKNKNECVLQIHGPYFSRFWAHMVHSCCLNLAFGGQDERKHN